MNPRSATISRRARPAIRRTLVLMAMVVPMAASAQLVRIPSAVTSITSSVQRMISYRFQEHMWQTPDGATHVMVNKGSADNGNTLTMHSTFDGGATWVISGTALPDSNGSSSSDGYLRDDRLHVTYEFARGIRYAELRYDAIQKAWLTESTEVVLESETVIAVTPAMAADAQGRQWLAYTQQDKATGNYSIRMLVRSVPEPGWLDTGLVFGNIDNISNERSARPVATSRGMGLVFTLRAEVFWAERLDPWTVTTDWPRSLIYTKGNPAADPYGTHYNVVMDAAGNLHLVSVDGGKLVYSRYLVANQAWSTKRLTPDIAAAYVQITLAGGSVMLITNSFSSGSVYQSADGGSTFVRTHALTHPAPVQGEEYTRPRMETPAISTNPVPVLQQYWNGTQHGALYFSVPAIKPAVRPAVPSAAEETRRRPEVINR